MARPERNEVDYFPFYCKEGKAMFIIEQKYGNDGYATWVKILRTLAVTNYHYLDLSNEIDVYYLATKCRISNDVLLDIINLLVIAGEIDKDIWEQKKVIWNQKFIDSIHDAYSRRNNKPIDRDTLIQMLGGLCTTITPQTAEKQNKNPQSKVKESKVNETKEEERKEKENLFEIFWKLYDHKKGKEVALKSWMKIDLNEMSVILKAVPEYVRSTPDKAFRKHPSTYLNGKHWHDEITFKQQNNGISTKQTMDERIAEAKRRASEKRSGQMPSIWGDTESFSDFETIQ